MHPLPLDPSSLPHWQWRIDDEGVVWLMTQTIRASHNSGMIDEDSTKRATVDTPIMETNTASLTGARLLERARRHGVKPTQGAEVDLRQSQARLTVRLALPVGRCARAKQVKRPRKSLKRLTGYTGLILRDLRRKGIVSWGGTLRDQIVAKRALVSQLRHHQPKGGDKLYALQNPEVDHMPSARPACAITSATAARSKAKLAT